MKYPFTIVTIVFITCTCFSSLAQEEEVVIMDEIAEAPKDTLVAYPGGDEALDLFIKTYLLTTKQAIANNVTGSVLVQFVVDETGFANNFKVIKRLGYGCDEQAIRVLRMVPHWQPGVIAGRRIKTTLQKNIFFTMQTPVATGEEKISIELIPESPSAFGEKQEDLEKYLQKVFVYPSSIKKNIPGAVVVKFRINNTGAADNIHIVAGLHEALDREVIRVLKSMPAWRPKRTDFKPVVDYKDLVIVFKNKKPLLQ